MTSSVTTTTENKKKREKWKQKVEQRRPDTEICSEEAKKPQQEAKKPNTSSKKAKRTLLKAKLTTKNPEKKCHTQTPNKIMVKTQVTSGWTRGPLFSLTSRSIGFSMRIAVQFSLRLAISSEIEVGCTFDSEHNKTTPNTSACHW